MNIANEPQTIDGMAHDADVRRGALDLITWTLKYKYSYNFSWMDRPIIQFPADILALQEIVWAVKPDLVVETGIAHGGSLVLFASLLELLGGDGRVIGVDIEIREHNRRALETHPMFKRMTLIEGSSTDESIVGRVRELAAARQRVLVVLDSMHTHDHVLCELELYSPLVTRDSYLVVFDTIIDDLPADAFPDRPWTPQDNPKTAVREFLTRTDRFVVDRSIEDKLLITAAPEGYLRCVKA
jgi:cephalosporin hydroxylase